jgi:predicted Zn-dependent protease
LFATLLGAYVAGEQGANVAGGLTGGYANTRFLLPRSREHELQADQLGAEYLQRVNFDPDVMIRVIGVLRAQEVFARDEARALGRNMDETPNWLRTHPSNDQRLADIKRIAAQYSGKYQDEGRARYLRAINGMTFGDSREHGVTRGQSFYHEPLGFTLRAPADWQFQNAPDELGIVANNMSAAVSMRLSRQSRGDHAAAIRNLLGPDQGRTEGATINGLRATHFVGSKQGRSIDATVITLNNLDYVFVKLQKAETRGAQTNTLRDIVASFRAMTPADRDNAKPYVLRTVAFPRSANPWAELARDVARIAPQLRNPEAQLRLLNQVYPQGTIAAGQLVKVIQ